MKTEPGNEGTVKPEAKSWLKSSLIELVVYAALVVAYFFLVLHLLGDWIYHLFERDRHLYAAAALGLIIAQGLVLEVLTRFLLAFIQRRGEDG